MRLFTKSLMAAIAFSAGAVVAEPDMAKYQKSCGVCHESGSAGAQKTHDVAAWEPLLDKGMDALLVSVQQGLNAMPPKGMCYDCTEEDYIALIRYMASPE
jgi:cytochrome c5